MIELFPFSCRIKYSVLPFSETFGNRSFEAASFVSVSTDLSDMETRFIENVLSSSELK